MSRVAYFIANDSVFEMATAFLHSFRLSNPELPLCLIPFDGSYRKILALKKTYRFEVFRKQAVLRGCDELGMHLGGKRDGIYRKLAMWEGDFDRFVYFDVDSVVLEDASFAFDLLDSYDFIASHSNIPENMKLVWRDGARRAGILGKGQFKYLGSTGFIASKKGAFTLRGMQEALGGALPLAPYMAAKEQSFINYLVEKSTLRRSSLTMIAAQNPDLDIPVEKWAGVPMRETSLGKLVLGRRRVLFVHWAGLWQRGSHRFSRLWRYHRAGHFARGLPT